MEVLIDWALSEKLFTDMKEIKQTWVWTKALLSYGSKSNTHDGGKFDLGNLFVKLDLICNKTVYWYVSVTILWCLISLYFKYSFNSQRQIHFNLKKRQRIIRNSKEPYKHWGSSCDTNLDNWKQSNKLGQSCIELMLSWAS